MVEVDAIVSMLLDRDPRPMMQTSTPEALTDLRTFFSGVGIVNSEDEYRALLHEVTIRLAREEVLRSARGDEEVIHAIKMLDDLSPTLNLLSEHLFEWYSMYEEDVLPSEDAVKEILNRREIPPAMRTLSQNLTDLYESRRILIEYIQDETTLIAPNLTNLAGGLLAARLISIAGGLGKLAKMPASRLQILGANRAMFRHLRGAAPPKHGVIFQHPLVHASPRRLRGRIARRFASKLVIAARIDYYSGEVREDLAESLAESLPDRAGNFILKC
jgi:nucleolar protein 56